MRAARPWLLGALLLGCGVAGAPRPTSPPAPTIKQVLCAPEGWLVRLERPGGLAWLGDAAPAPIRGAVLRIPRQKAQQTATLRLAGADAAAPGPPGAPITLPWVEPPPPPPAPLAFFGGDGVQVSWLPPPTGTVAVHLLRDGRPLQRLPAAAGSAADPAPKGAHRYAVRFEGAQTLTAPSPPTAVTVP